MSKTLGMEVVAERVVTEEQVALLSSLEVDYCQGYFFSKPLPLMEFINYLLNHSEKTEDVMHHDGLALQKQA